MKDKQGKILSGKSKVCLLVKQRKIRNIFFISFYFHNETLEGHRIDIPRPPTHTHTQIDKSSYIWSWVWGTGWWSGC